jgi:hypothetical protein
MRYCAKKADAAGLPIFLIAFPGAYRLYNNLGYQELDHFDEDLSERGPKFNGYGVYRSYGMLRKAVGGNDSDN